MDEIPSVKEIFNEILSRTKWKDLATRVKADPRIIGTVFPQLEREAWDRYNEYEATVKEKWKSKKSLDVLENSLRQGRQPRGGYSSELIFQHLLTLSEIHSNRWVKYPEWEEGEQLDIVIPSKVIMYSDPAKTVVISIKRRVRERWREVVGEAYILREIHKYGGRIFFVTFEADLEAYAVQSLQKLNVSVYTPESHSSRYSAYGVRPVASIVADLVALMDTGELAKA